MESEQPGSMTAAIRWFSAVIDDADLNTAWQCTAPDLQLALVQGWMMSVGISNRSDRDALAQSIARDTTHPAWSRFASFRLTRWRDITFSSFSPVEWGTFSEVEPAAPEVEFVRFVDDGNVGYVGAGESMMAQTLTVQLVGATWLVAGIGRTIAQPGWPPTEQRLPTLHQP